jgi:hypothetical protein
LTVSPVAGLMVAIDTLTSFAWVGLQNVRSPPCHYRGQKGGAG